MRTCREGGRDKMHLNVEYIATASLLKMTFPRVNQDVNEDINREEILEIFFLLEEIYIPILIEQDG